MKIKELKEHLNNAKDDECDVEFWLRLGEDSELCELVRIGEFGIVPDITITVKPVEDVKVYSSKPLTEEQLNYKEKYEKILETIDEIRNIIW